MAEEVRPPKGEQPITWILLSNLPVTTGEQVLEKLQWYLCRWQIEIFFRILESGCKVEKLQLECTDRLRPALAMTMIVARHVLYLTLPGRECTDLTLNFRDNIKLHGLQFKIELAFKQAAYLIDAFDYHCWMICM